MTTIYGRKCDVFFMLTVLTGLGDTGPFRVEVDDRYPYGIMCMKRGRMLAIYEPYWDEAITR